MLEHNLEFYVANQDAFDALTDEQVMALSRGEIIPFVDGDTAPAAESKGEPDPAQVVKEEAPVVKEVDPVLMAKDGVHTIPFQRLKDAEAKAAEFETLVKSQAELIESLKQAKAEDAKTGGTEAQDAVLTEYQGEFPEVAGDLIPFIQKMIDAGVTAKTSEMKAQLDAQLAPMKQASADKAVDAHFAAIEAAIPDFDAIKPEAVEAWIKTQPSFAQAPALNVLEKGKAAEVIELYSAYKASLGTQTDVPAKPSKEDLKLQAAAAIANAKGKTPTSLTDLPSGTKAEVDGLSAEANMGAMQLLDKFMGMSPDKILKHAARLV